jgi:pyruvate,water dikinase
MLGLIRGRVYYNLLNWYRVLALLPGFKLNRRFMEQMMGVKEELPDDFLAEFGEASVSDRVKDGFDLAFSLAALVANLCLLPRKIRRFQRRLNEALAPPARPLEVMTADDLSDYFLGLEKKLLTRWDAPLLNDFFAMIFYGVLRRLLAAWVNDTAGTLQNDLLCGEGGMISAEPAARIRELAELASGNAGLVKLLCAGPPAAILSAMEEIPEFKSAYLEYLARFGDRCLEELKLESSTLHDDPLLLLRAVGHLARSRSSDAGVEPPIDEVDARRNAETRVHQALALQPLRRVLFRWVLRHTRTRVRDRENLRFERTRLFGRVRRIFVELGRRLHAEGHLQDPRHVFWLEIDEVLGFIAGTATTTKLQELVALRQAEFSEYRATAPPPNRFTTRGIVNHRTPWQGIQPAAPNVEGQHRKGIGCCPGVVRGRVHKVTDPRKASIQAGEILVAERTDPGWIVLFPAAAGLLVERGSLLSHSAIVAREMRLPAIVSVDGLMDWLRDGDQVEFDGSTGVVRRIEETPTAVASAATDKFEEHQPGCRRSALIHSTDAQHNFID